MQQNKKSGWRTFWLLLGGILLLAAGLWVAFRGERRLMRLYRRTGERLRVRPSRFETSF